LYCCQQDGMVGLGCGARSYTTTLHYSSDYAVGPRHVNQILRAFVERPDSASTTASYGFRLDDEECRRRYVLLSLLFHEGLSLTAYQQTFGSDLFDDLPELAELLPPSLATCAEGHLRLTPTGIERSDTIGPWLFSSKVRGGMESFALQ
nr:coproporphyrinogen III oxidase family protein [Ardenticatenales bacterium]